MLHEHRSLITGVLSAGVGATGLWVWPFPADNAVLRLIQVAHPTLWTGMAYAYATLWFTTMSLPCNVVTSLMDVFLGRIGRQEVNGPIPPYPAPSTPGDLFVVLGEQHHAHGPMRSTEPQWLTHSRGRPVYRHGHHRGGRHRQDFGLHLSLCGAAPRVRGG
jgi:hypothetical protein